MNRTLLSVLFLIAGFQGVLFGAQPEKRPLTHEDYSGWNTIANQRLSGDGQWIIYEVNPQQGDGVMIIKNLVEGKQTIVPRGFSAVISPGNRFAVFYIRPPRALVRQAQVEGRKRDQMPTDSLGIFYFDKNKLVKIPGPVTFALPDEASDWLVYHVYASVMHRPDRQGGDPGMPDGLNASTDNLQDKNDEKKKLFAYNPVTGARHTIANVEEYLISPLGTLVAAITDTIIADTLKMQQIVGIDLLRSRTIRLDPQKGDLESLVADRAGQNLAWLFTTDTGKVRHYGIWLWEGLRNRALPIVVEGTPGLPDGNTPSRHRRPFFSRNGERLFFGTAPKPVEEPKDTLLADERFSVDVWHWQDGLLQSQQLHNLQRELNRTFLAVYHIRSRRVVQLASPDMPDITLDTHNDALFALGISNVPYLMESSWRGITPRDLFAVNLNDGSRHPIANRVISMTSLSPEGRFVIWFEPQHRRWLSFEMRTKAINILTTKIPVSFYNEEQDLPALAGPYGVGGWTENDEFVLLNDRFDVWKVDPTGRRDAVNLTQGYGREHSIRFRTQDLNPVTPFVDLTDPVVFHAFHITTKQSGFFQWHNNLLSKLIFEDAAFSQLQKALFSDRMIWRRSTFRDFPDIFTSKPGFNNPSRISNANPQQANVLWGSVKLVEWMDFNNRALQGLLYLPENFDPNNKYPMVVYFYERSSDGLHQHFIPAPSRSIINRTFFTSNGYIVFVPDIFYTEGFPGQSAYNAVVSGTKAMVERFPFIDRSNMGLQGQSWGGYQVAFLITRTNMFRAAMAGAPVSNMISAYNAIRWESGRSRQFQYEETQSRIGGSLWEKKELFIENSPIFFADRIQTPLLMMHNDNDGAVHYFQGIELFLAMRRLSLPVWMLVYNNEEHNLTRWPNRMDLSIRMQQFFDHFLKGAPAPVWLKHGLPALQKGRMTGYELVQ